MKQNQEFLQIAQKLAPKFNKRIVHPKRLVAPVYDRDAFHYYRCEDAGTVESLYAREFYRTGDVTLDFGEHLVGYLQMTLKPKRSPNDAPLRLQLTFGEIPCEVAIPASQYDGRLSAAWLQTEVITIDVLPCRITLPRRYSFRYLRIEVIDTSGSYAVNFSNIRVTAVTSADLSKVKPLPESVPQDLRQLDAVSIATLRDCMQSVFEDGPKRDRRLWLGDLRLQARVNYETVQNYDLVKRCLYLFAALPMERGQVGACLFLEPKPQVDPLYLLDYSLFFVSVLRDYYEVTGDRTALVDLYAVACKQIKLAAEYVDSSGCMRLEKGWFCFVDWADVDKLVPAQGIFLYTLQDCKVLAETMQDVEMQQFADALYTRMKQAAVGQWFDRQQGLFRSNGQISYASQVWMILSGAVSKQQGKDILLRLQACESAVEPNTPYMHHHYIEAMLYCDMKDEALAAIRAYWGGMLADGADTFFEAYNLKNRNVNPYARAGSEGDASSLINSYCHAWSCTPAYWIRKYFAET